MQKQKWARWPTCGLTGLGNGRLVLSCFLGLAGAVLLRAAQYSFSELPTAIEGRPLFASPNDVALDSAGNLYVADSANHTIRKISPNGTTTTFAGARGLKGVLDGRGSATRFDDIQRLAFDGNGQLYALDVFYEGGSNRAGVRRISPDGTVTTILRAKVLWGQLGPDPWWDRVMAVDRAGNVYLHDGNAKQFCKLTPTGDLVPMASTADPTFTGFEAIVVDGVGNLYVSGLKSQLSKVSPTGEISAVLDPKAVLFDGPTGKVQLSLICDLEMDAGGNVVAADRQRGAVFRIGMDGRVTRLAGDTAKTRLSDGGLGDGSLLTAKGLAVAPDGTIWITDSTTIRRLSTDGWLSTFAGVTPHAGGLDGVGAAFGLNSPEAIAVGANGEVYIADGPNFAVRKIGSDGALTTVAGRLGVDGCLDGFGNASRFYWLGGIALDSRGYLFVRDGPLVRRISPAGEVLTIAGVFDRRAYQDGDLANARFLGPGPIAVDKDGVLYLTDGYAVRKIVPAGKVTTLAGSATERGTTDGTGSSARFWKMEGIGVDSKGVVYVADYGTIRAITPDGIVSTLAGVSGNIRWQDGKGRDALMDQVVGLAVAPSDEIFVTESVGRVRKITPEGKVTTVAGAGAFLSSVEFGVNARFVAPSGIAVDSGGNLYVADGGARSIFRGSLVPDGLPLITQQPESRTDKLGNTVTFKVTVQSSSAVSYQWQRRAGGGFTWRDITPSIAFGGVESATLTVVATTAELNGDQYRCAVKNEMGTNVSAPAILQLIEPKIEVTLQPVDVVATDGYDTYFSIGARAEPREITAHWQRSIDGGSSWTDLVESEIFGDTQDRDLRVRASWNLNGNAFRCRFTNNFGDEVISHVAKLQVIPAVPYDFSTVAIVPRVESGWWGYENLRRSIAVDRSGNLFLADTVRHVILKIRPRVASRVLPKPNDRFVPELPAKPEFEITTLAGVAGQRGSADGVGANARFSEPASLAVDNVGNVYVADTGNETIRKIDGAGVVTTLAGRAGQAGIADGRGAAARFSSPFGIAVDRAGTVYVAGRGSTLRKITPDGIVTTIAGSPAESGSMDGVGAHARFMHPTGVAVDADGNVYVADEGNQTIRKVTPAGVVTTLAGKAGEFGHADGLGSSARFGSPATVAVDEVGNVYVADAYFSAVRKIDPAGLVSTIGGRVGQYSQPDRFGYYRDGVGPDARFCAPCGIAVDDGGRVYLADNGSVAIRKGEVQVPVVARAPAGGAVAAGASYSLEISTYGPAPTGYSWQFNGRDIDASNSPIFALSNVLAINAGLYSVQVKGAAEQASAPAIIAIAPTGKLGGSAEEVGSDIVYPNGNRYDQVLLQGAAATITADAGQVTRISYVDLDDDIVQVEFSGAGSLTLRLENASEPAPPANYNQPNVSYVKGHASIVIAGADASTNVSVFSVGRANAVNQALFKDGASYDGVADIAYIAIMSADGKFGGVRTANANYFASKGTTGLYAPGVEFVGPVYIGNVTAFDTAAPALILGAAADISVTGGDLFQANGRAVEIAGFSRLRFAAGATSHGQSLPAQTNQARLQREGVDVTDEIVAAP